MILQWLSYSDYPTVTILRIVSYYDYPISTILRRPSCDHVLHNSLASWKNSKDSRLYRKELDSLLRQLAHLDRHRGYTAIKSRDSRQTSPGSSIGQRQTSLNFDGLN